jgi:hypothetical protein
VCDGALLDASYCQLRLHIHVQFATSCPRRRATLEDLKSAASHQLMQPPREAAEPLAAGALATAAAAAASRAASRGVTPAPTPGKSPIEWQELVHCMLMVWMSSNTNDLAHVRTGVLTPRTSFAGRCLSPARPYA